MQQYKKSILKRKRYDKLNMKKKCNICGRVLCNELNVCPNCGSQLHNKDKSSKIHLNENAEAIILITLTILALVVSIVFVIYYFKLLIYLLNLLFNTKFVQIDPTFDTVFYLLMEFLSKLGVSICVICFSIVIIPLIFSTILYLLFELVNLKIDFKLEELPEGNEL